MKIYRCVHKLRILNPKVSVISDGKGGKTQSLLVPEKSCFDIKLTHLELKDFYKDLILQDSLPLIFQDTLTTRPVPIPLRGDLQPHLGQGWGALVGSLS